ncbi:MAG: DUF2200 domain-containing protein [Altererythrobacter sp.]
MAAHRIFAMPFAGVHRAYIAKVEKKGRTREELAEVIRWMTGYTQAELDRHIEAETDFTQFFGEAPLNPDRTLITGKVCGVQVEAVEDPLMREIRYLDKLVDELAKGRPMEKILRKP